MLEVFLTILTALIINAVFCIGIVVGIHIKTELDKNKTLKSEPTQKQNSKEEINTYTKSEEKSYLGLTEDVLTEWQNGAQGGTNGE